MQYKEHKYHVNISLIFHNEFIGTLKYSKSKCIYIDRSHFGLPAKASSIHHLTGDNFPQYSLYIGPIQN